MQTKARRLGYQQPPILRPHNAEKLRCRRDRRCLICNHTIRFGDDMAHFRRSDIAVHWTCLEHEAARARLDHTQ